MTQKQKELLDRFLERPPFPKWIQITICSSILLIIFYISIIAIGDGEYIEQYCTAKIEENGKILKSTDKVGILKNYVDQYKRSEILEGVNISYNYGCCIIPEGEKYISKRKNCVNAGDYKPSTFNQKISYFLKKFK